MESAFDNIRLPEGASFILERLRQNGREGYIVGGSVRDIIMGKIPNDYDITTSASPDELKSIFSDMRTIDIGIRHGTLGVLVNGILYEVTTYRIDGGYTDSRHPDSVKFTRNLKDDLSRRDFTVNAIAYNNDNGVVDLFSGIEDIKNRKIRAVGDPVLRFSEDALRILRALRFSSVLDFEIDKETSDAIFEKAYLLLDISRERILEEWKKLIGGTRAYKVISEYSEIFKLIFSALSEIKLPCETAFLKGSPTVRELSLFALGTGAPACAYELAMTALHSDTKRIKFGASVLECLSLEINGKADIKRILYKIGISETETLLSLRETLYNREEPYIEMLADILKRGEVYSLKQLAIGGADLLSLGIRGERVGACLLHLLNLVIEDPSLNKRKYLLEVAEKEFSA